MTNSPPSDVQPSMVSEYQRGYGDGCDWSADTLDRLAAEQPPEVERELRKAAHVLRTVAAEWRGPAGQQPLASAD